MIFIVEMHPLVSFVGFVSIHTNHNNLLLAGSVLHVECILPVFCSQNELPEPEQDNGGTTESVKEQEMKWTDLALQYLHENVPPTGN